ncbi:MAG: LD-carboxypeptidase [Deltaproteobacteria bacterium]|nr:LD-carboxypeptidase [Deltaproteobacteria bacterium]
MILPPPVRPGETIGVVAPGGAVKADALESGVASLEALGFRVRLGAHVLARRRYLAGTVEMRHADLVAMLVDPDVGAIVCARGGYGTSHLLPLLDPALLTARPKLVVGYSDVSPLLGWIIERCGVVALHGPMVATDLAKGLSARAAARLVDLLASPGSPWREPVADVVAGGGATGRLVGGCLSSLVALLGTPYAVETTGAVLFLEDVAERPYRVDRMLTHLRLAGKLDAVAAVVLGSFAECDGVGEDVVAEVFRDFFADAPYPVVAGFPAGHLSENLPLALGLPVRVDADAGWVEAVAA